MTERAFMIYRTFFWAALIGVPLVNPVSAQIYDAYSLADSVTVGQRFELLVSVEHDGARTAVFPHEFLPDSLADRPAFEVGGFTVLGHTAVGRRALSEGWFTDSLRYEVATFELDSAYVPMLPVGLASASDTLIAATPPILVWVKSLVPEDAEGIRDITQIAEFRGLAWYWYAIVLLLLAALAYWIWQRRKEDVVDESTPEYVEPEEPPLDEAERRLRELERMDLSDPALVKPFFVELSDIFRTYLARRTRVPALESTTRELIERLQQALDSGMVPPEIVNEVASVLSQADLVKFADMKPASEDGRSALFRTRTAIEGAEARFHARMRQARSESSEAEHDNAEMETTDHVE